jgi:hypothetical protein
VPWRLAVVVRSEVFADVEVVWSWHPDADAKLVVIVIRR